MYYTLLCNDWDLSYFILIPDLLHTYKRWLTYSVCVGQSYECVLTPPITMAMAKFGVGVWQDGDGNSRL